MSPTLPIQTRKLKDVASFLKLCLQIYSFIRLLISSHSFSLIFHISGKDRLVIILHDSSTGFVFYAKFWLDRFKILSDFNALDFSVLGDSNFALIYKRRQLNSSGGSSLQKLQMKSDPIVVIFSILFLTTVLELDCIDALSFFVRGFQTFYD